MSYTDGMPYDAVFEIVEGQVDLTMNPKFQNQTQNVGTQRLAIPAGVSRIMATWNHPGQRVRIQWGAVVEGTNFTVTSWSEVILNATAGPAMQQVTIPTVHGALVRVQTVGGVPDAGAVAAKPRLGLEVFPSLSSGAVPN